MRRYSPTISLLAGAALACANEPTKPPLIAEAPAADMGAVEVSVTGQGRAQLPAGFTDLEFQFHAVQLHNGIANGQFRIFWANASGTNDFHGRVTCVSMDPVNRRAWIGGVVTQNNSTHPSGANPERQVGRDIWFRVVDNDGRNGATPDRLTVAGFEGAGGIITSAEYCATQAWADNDVNTWPGIAGDIRLR